MTGKFLCLCYHYIRPTKDGLYGQTEAEFETHLDMLQTNYEILSPSDLFTNKALKKTGMLITFDDGLSDHYRAAQILFQRNLKAIFFIPTCIFQENLPPNPTIIHYILDRYRVGGFLQAYDLLPKKFLRPEIDRLKSAHDIIKQIKFIFKYTIGPAHARDMLVWMYKNTLLKDDPGILLRMNLCEPEVRTMLKMGHTIGIHSRTHPNVAFTYSSSTYPVDFEKEINEPRKFMSDRFETEILFFSYPFGHRERDCYKPGLFRKKQKGYSFAFTVEEKLNTEKTDPFDLGRLMPHSTDTPEILKSKLEKIENETRHLHVEQTKA